jgi:hypothetical protein
MRPNALLLALSLVAATIPLAPARPASAFTPPQCGGITFAPTTTIYLPNITKTLGGPTGWVTPFIVQNVGFVSTTLEVSFYRFSDGALVTCRKVNQLAPARSFADVPNNDTDLPDNAQFSVVVRSYGSEIVAVVNEQNGVGARAEALAYDGLSAGATRVGLPYVAVQAASMPAGSGTWLSTVIAQNVGSVTASVTASFISLDGSKSATISRTIAPGRSAFIDTRFEPSLTVGTEYSVVLTSTSPIAAVVNSHNDTSDVARPRAFAYNGFSVGASALTFLPLVAKNASGIGTSRLVVQNAGNGAARPTLDLARNTDGVHAVLSSPSPLQSGSAWSTDLASAAMGDGEYGATVSVGQFAALDIVLSPTTSMAFVAGASSPSRIFLPNVTRTLGGTNGWTTPIVVQRPSDGPSSIALRWYRFADGILVKQQVITAPFGGASVRVDPRDVAELSDNTQYAVVVDAKGPVVALVQEMNLSGGASAMIYPGFTSPVAPQSVPTVIALTQSTTTVPIGGTMQLTARVTDQFAVLTSASAWPVTWTVSPSSLGSITSAGVFTATGYGSGKITASAGAQASSVTVTVQSPPGRPAVSVPVGYSYQTVPTPKGTFGAYVIKRPLSDVTIKTATDNASDCIADCPAQPLVEYLNQTATSEGMNGTYFCPPDYSSCASKVNSYDYSVYSSYLPGWLNEWALVSPTNSLVTVKGKTVRFYNHTYDYDRSPIDAAISNFPMLLLGGQVVDSEAIQQDHQRERGFKGSIGTDGTYVYLVLATGVSVTESAYVVQALGETDAMNLDGGGSSAMFAEGEYKVGPSRQLPNAVLLARP